MMKKRVFNNALLFLLLGSILGLTSCKKDPVEGDTDKNNGNKPAIELCGLLSEEGDIHLTNDPERPVDYIVSCEVIIQQRKLFIEEGTIIEFESNGRIGINRHFDDHSGAIIAKGTADKPIIFRGTQQERGHWRGIYIGTNNSFNELDHVIIRDAGKDAYTHGGQAGLIYGNQGSGFGRLKLTNSQLINNKMYGLQITGVNGGYTTDAQIIENNIIKDNDAPVLSSIHTLHLLGASNDFRGNDNDIINVIGSNNATDNTLIDGTWQNHKIPYLFLSDVYIDSKITIAAGTEMRFAKNHGMIVGRVSGPAGTGGGIIAKGTTEEPIVFTAEEPIEKYWKGIRFASNYPANEISNAIIEYTGIISSDPNLVFNTKVETSGYIKMEDIVFRYSNRQECAIWAVFQSEAKYGIAEYERITVEDDHCEYALHALN